MFLIEKIYISKNLNKPLPKTTDHRGGDGGMAMKNGRQKEAEK